MKTLEKIVKTAKGFLIAGLLTVIAGCSAYFPISNNRGYGESKGIYAEAGARTFMDFGMTDVNLSRQKRTIPVHPDDGGAEKGGVTANLDGWGVRFGCGLEGSIGNECLRFKIGGDIKSSIENEQRKLQPLPPPYESYGGATLEPSPVTIIPFIGIDAKLYDKYIAGLEIGFPYSGYEFRSWHERYNSKEIIEKASHTGFGQSFNIKIGYVFDKEQYHSISLSYGQELHKLRVGGKKADIRVHNISILFGIKF